MRLQTTVDRALIRGLGSASTVNSSEFSNVLKRGRLLKDDLLIEVCGADLVRCGRLVAELIDHRRLLRCRLSTETGRHRQRSPSVEDLAPVDMSIQPHL
jgi:hypothetical protein